MDSEANLHEDVPLEECDTKNPSCQQDSAYGSLESSSNGQSQKSFDGSGRKSLHSGSSHSSGFGDQNDFKGIHLRGESAIALKETCKVGDKNTETISKTSSGSEATSKKEVETKKLTEESLQEANETEEKVNCENKFLSSQPRHSCFEQRDGSQTSLVYTQALNYIRKIKERSAEQGVPFASPYLSQLSPNTQDLTELFKSFKSIRGFTVAISIQDGSVLQVSSSITDILGFPKDMLLGQSFIDFVYPKDSINFSSKIINGLSVPFRSSAIKDSHGTTFFCRLRMYHGLKNTGYGIRNKKTSYKPCKIIFKFQDTSTFTETSASTLLQSSIIIAEIIPIESAYKEPDDDAVLGNFSTRHSSSCNFSEYDPEAIPYLGHLPQDLTGNSIFDYYHPDDMPKLKNIYIEIVKHQGKPYRSEPYRFRTFNNSWVTLFTEWLCFVNPWTIKIESIIGQHRILKAPEDTNIFDDPSNKGNSPIPEEVIVEAQASQKEILELLMKPLTSYQDPCKEPMVKRRRTLAHIMSPFVEELDNIGKRNDNQQPNPSLSYSQGYKSLGTSFANEAPLNYGSSVQKNNARNCQIGVLPSIITPGQESLNSSVETPSSYGQLNYSATLQRFFKSNPKTMSSDESGDSKMETSHQESIGFSTSASANRKSQSQSRSRSQSGSGSGSGDNNFQSKSFQKSNTKIKYGEIEGTVKDLSRDGQSYMLPLTEEILSRHNQHMQKQFIEYQRRNERILNSNKYHLKTKPFKKYTKKREKSYPIKKSGGPKVYEGNTPKPTIMNPSVNIPDKNPVPSTLYATKRSESIGATGRLEKTFPSTIASRPVSNIQSERNIKPKEDPAPSFQRILPSYYIQPGPNSASVSSIPNISRHPATPPPCPVPTDTALPFTAPPLMLHSQSTYLSPQPLSVQYVAGLPNLLYQPIAPPLFSAPTVMLPNLVFQHTLVQPPKIPMPVTVSGDERRYGTESEQELIEGTHQATKQSLLHQTEKQVLRLQRPDSQATSVKAEPGSGRGSNASASCKLNAAESIRSYVDELSIHQNIPHSKQERSQTPNFSRVSPFSQSTSVIAELESVRSPEKQERLVEEPETKNYNSSDMILSGDSFSDAEEKSEAEEDHPNQAADPSSTREKQEEKTTPEYSMPGSRPVLREPPWIESTKVTSEILFHYQLKTKELVDVLKQDMDLLKNTKQSSYVEDQLAALYCELELDGEKPELHIEEGNTNSSSSDEQQCSHGRHHSLKKNKRPAWFYSKLAMLHEEEAPMPMTDDITSSE